MRHLLVARVGNYDEGSRRLNTIGIGQTNSLIDAFGGIIDTSTCYIMRSPAPRVVDGSDLFAKRLKLISPAEDVPYLWDAPDIPVDMFGDDPWSDFYHHCKDDGKLMGLVYERSDRADALVILSHKDLVSQFSHYFAFTEFGIELDKDFPVEMGQGIYFDVVNETVKIIP